MAGFVDCPGCSGDGGNLQTKFAQGPFDSGSGFGFDSSGFNVNFGGLQSNASGGSGGRTGGVPQWVWYAAAAAGVLWLLKHHKK